MVEGLVGGQPLEERAQDFWNRCHYCRRAAFPQQFSVSSFSGVEMCKEWFLKM
jgi:hypothetical protein